MAAANVIEIYQKNSKTIELTITGLNDISDYTPLLSVKKLESDASTLIFNGGVITDASGTVSFALLPADTSLAIGDYVYDVNIESSTNTYTVTNNIFTILDSVRN